MSLLGDHLTVLMGQDPELTYRAKGALPAELGPQDLSRLKQDQCAVPFLRKEWIQPHLPIRLPWWLHPNHLSHLGRLAYGYSPTSGVETLVVWRAVCKAGNAFTAACWSAITSDPTSCGELQPTIRTEIGFKRLILSSPTRDCCTSHCSTCSPGHKGHDDLTSSSPSSGLLPAVSQSAQLNDGNYQ